MPAPFLDHRQNKTLYLETKSFKIYNYIKNYNTTISNLHLEDKKSLYYQSLSKKKILHYFQGRPPR
jgi:hypothetical protein